VASAAEEEEAPAEEQAPPSRVRWVVRKLWWLHSGFALSFGVGVMLFARAGLKYADKVMVALLGSWLLMFIAFRFITGPANRREDEKLIRKGIRVATNYIIKQFYQQMFFFLTPLYASSATWSFASWNWWLPPLLLVCAVLSTMDLVFDNFVMEHRFVASGMYGLAMFGMLNVMLPLLVGVDHFTGLVIAAAATPASVAFLSFSVRQVLSPQGAVLMLGMTALLLAGVTYGKRVIPPAPLAMSETTVGHGTLGSYECLPPSKHMIRASQLDGLRCGSMLREPGGLKEAVVHVWTHRGHAVGPAIRPDVLVCDDGDAVVVRSYLPKDRLPADPTGKWACETYTAGGQLVGIRKFEVLTATGQHAAPDDSAGSGAPKTATPTPDAGAGVTDASPSH
jgi:hypothetical protein